MKVITSILLLLASTTMYSQMDNVVGEYFYLAGENGKHLTEYTLTLQEDGTFHFHSYEDHQRGISWERNKYGKGNWRMDGKIVSFITDKEKDIDEKYTLDFSNSKARFITKPERDKTDRKIETKLQFFESEIFWIERLKILKNKNAIQQRP
ncbi:hypothetical protein [uncultured Muriicola sp.]|uniref:hypothetical protein n=1 Tax=uncultured Muriicola sp. TaxID=1583102 RepID=UPI0026115E02|nr:hypothetical protein [uncultured Muriicola sp.]